MKLVKRLSVLVLSYFILVVLAGCSGTTPPPTTQTPGIEEHPQQNQPETTNTSTTQAPEKKEISLPQGWEMKDAISAEEIGAIAGEKMTYVPDDHSNAKDGKPSCAYIVAGQELSWIGFSVDTNGGNREFANTKEYAVKDSLKEVSGIGDKAYICDISEQSVIVVQKGETIIRVIWYPKYYSTFDKVDFGKKLAEKLLENMYK